MQRCCSPCSSWSPTKGHAYNEADRVTAQFAPQPFGTFEQWTTTYDQNDYYGLPATKTDPMGVGTTATYNAMSALAPLKFSSGTPAEIYAYDGDGRVTSIESGGYGTDQYS